MNEKAAMFGPASAMRNRDGQLASIVTAVGLILTALFGHLAHEQLGFLDFDDITHFEFARWAWRWPAYLFHDWGRPGFTAMYALPAGLGTWEFGWKTCRLWSAAICAVTAWLAFLVAKRAGLRHAWLAAALCYLQPLFFQLSQTTLTETPLALYLAGAVVLAQSKRWVWSATLLSIAAVTRYETIVLFPVWIAVGWRSGVRGRRLLGMLAVLTWAPALANLGAWLSDLAVPFALYFQPRPSSQGEYGSGGWLTFFSRSLEAWGPGISVLTWTGIVGCMMRGTLDGAAGDVGLRLTVLVTVIYFAAQTTIHALGSFASGGYARFLVPLSPLVAVAAVAGLNWLIDRRWRHNCAAATVAALVMVLLVHAMEQQIELGEARGSIHPELRPLIAQAARALYIARGVIVAAACITVVGAAIGYRRWGADSKLAMGLRSLVPCTIAAITAMTGYFLCRPLGTHPEVLVTQETIRWIGENGYAGREVISPVPLLDLVTNRQLDPWRPPVSQQIAAAPAGVIVALDRKFARSTDHRLDERQFSADPTFRCIYKSKPLREGDTSPYLTLFEKVAAPEYGRSDEGH